MTDYHTLRNTLDHELQLGAVSQARERLRELWNLQPSSSTAAFILSMRPTLAAQTALRKFRVAVLRSFTVEPVVPQLQALGLLHGLDLDVHIGAFNAYAQEMLEPPAELRDFKPDIVILCVRTPDLLPEIWDQFPDVAPEDVPRIIQNSIEHMRSWLHAFRRHCDARLIVHSLELPATPANGLLDHANPEGQVEVIADFNRRLKSLAAQLHDVSVLDYDGLIARHGRESWSDPIRWSTIRLPISGQCLRHLAGEWLRHIYGMVGQTRKVLVTDLDNTLWGGLAGEEGLGGVQLGKGHVGIGYLRLQRALLDLSRRGILLAVCSKNNQADAMRIMEQHPEMLLRPEHFAAIRINWQDKAVNLREIAAELNLGTEALVFLDDNPVERQRVRTDLPEVEVIELPSDSIKYEKALRDSVVFERFFVTEEDQLRGQRYREQRDRVVLAQAAGSLDEFYRLLKQVVTIAPVKPETLSRVAQLTQKTNQFNLTTRRYSETQIAELMSSPGWSANSIQVEDRFGDNGIVGVVITHSTNGVCVIDTLVLSCRVIGRTIESAILSYLVEESVRTHMREIRGQFIPTKKNAPAAQLYPSHGFTQTQPKSNGNGNGHGPSEGTWWVLELRSADVQSPKWIELRVRGEQVHTEYVTR